MHILLVAVILALTIVQVVLAAPSVSKDKSLFVKRDCPPGTSASIPPQCMTPTGSVNMACYTSYASQIVCNPTGGGAPPPPPSPPPPPPPPSPFTFPTFPVIAPPTFPVLAPPALAPPALPAPPTLPSIPAAPALTLPDLSQLTSNFALPGLPSLPTLPLADDDEE